MGNLPSEQVFEYEKKAKLLVNLRDPSVELTKYAFPSKILEYMSSGSAVLTTKLEGIPNEYFSFINTVDNLTYVEVKNAIEKIGRRWYNIVKILCVSKFYIEKENVL